MMRALFAASVFMFSVASSSAVDCEAYIKLHGFLSRAQFQCGFSRYAKDVLVQARDCGQHMSETRMSESLSSGMKLFDERETERGHAAICNSVLKDFPKAVGR
jgi:hypothetical protein